MRHIWIAALVAGCELGSMSVCDQPPRRWLTNSARPIWQVRRQALGGDDRRRVG